jgi:hypothetical protein
LHGSLLFVLVLPDPSAALPESLSDCRLQVCESRFHVLAKVHAQSAPAAFRKHREVSARLRSLHHTEGVFLFGNGEIGSVVTRDLQEDAAVGPALVRLTCRV